MTASAPLQMWGNCVRWLLVLVAAIGGVWLGAAGTRLVGNDTTTRSLSPDDVWRVSLVEISPKVNIDRDFTITLEELAHDRRPTQETLFKSPDEGRPVGSERFIWSKDSTYVLLVGRRFTVAQDIAVGNGEQAYFLYHVPSKRSWCNARQVNWLPAITPEILGAIDFVQPLTLRGGAAAPAEAKKGTAESEKAGATKPRRE